MEFCGIIAYYFQTSFLQSATGLETFLSFFKGRAISILLQMADVFHL